MSLRSDIIAFGFRLIPFRTKAIKFYLSLSSNKKSYFRSSSYPFWLKKKWKISEFLIERHQLFLIEQKNNNTPKHVIFYLHGGGYIFKATGHHWRFVNRFLRKLSCSIVFPDYPISPDYSQDEILKMVVKSYKKTVEKYGNKKIIIMGDSAGGGMSLALVQKLKKEKIAMPDQVIMLSPWLDISMSNPRIKPMAHLDPFLDLDTVKLAAETFAKNENLQKAELSPIYGSLEGLPKMSVFIGTHDVLYSDCVKLKELCDKKGIDLSYFEYPKMIHVWMLFHFPESKMAMKEIFSLIK